jgi:hypothetical protein
MDDSVELEVTARLIKQTQYFKSTRLLRLHNLICKLFQRLQSCPLEFLQPFFAPFGYCHISFSWQGRNRER